MPIIDPNQTQPAPNVPAPPTDAQRAFRVRQVAGQLRDQLTQSLSRIKSIAQRGDGVQALAAQLDSENVGDAAEFQTIFNDGKALLALLDAVSATEIGDL